MTTVNTVATTDVRRSRGGMALPALLGITCLLAGVSLMVTLASGLRDLSANSGQMQHLLALNAPATGELVESLGPAGPGVDNMAFYAALCAAGLAAALLLVAGAMHLSASHLKHPDAARRVAGGAHRAAFAANFCPAVAKYPARSLSRLTLIGRIRAIRGY